MSAQQPLVSILISNYNYGRFLRDAIDSALHQTYANTEVIVVDDGSTDDSREIIASYGRRIISILKENGGQASALNAGFAASEGELICLLDSDDVWMPEKIEKVVAACILHPGAILIYHRAQLVSSDLRPSKKTIPTGVFMGDVAAKVKKSGGWWAFPPTSALCFRRTALQQIGPIPEKEFRICADVFLSYVAPLLGPVLGLKDWLALYRLHGANGFSVSTHKGSEDNTNRLLWYVHFFETAVSCVNNRLGQLGTQGILSLEDHWSYQFQKFCLGAPGRRSAIQLAWEALWLPGEPATINRLKIAANVILDSRMPRGRERS